MALSKKTYVNILKSQLKLLNYINNNRKYFLKQRLLIPLENLITGSAELLFDNRFIISTRHHPSLPLS